MAGRPIKSRRSAKSHVEQHLGVLLDLPAQVRQGGAEAVDGRQDLQGGDDAVPGAGAVAADDVPGGLAAEDAEPLLEPLHDVAVADLGAGEADPQPLQGVLQPQIAHDGADHLAAQGPRILAGLGDDVDQLVAVHQAPLGVHHQDPVAVAVEGDP